MNEIPPHSTHPYLPLCYLPPPLPCLALLLIDDIENSERPPFLNQSETEELCGRTPPSPLGPAP